jgi:catechol 2,3-dioxygenase-like lactoylglutathione lyase family enzyme
LFLGIDHTAIVVADTERSLRFYRDLLGLQVAGGSENFGTEQEHLNNVERAHLRITALRAPEGPGVEFLEYLEPRDGRSFPVDARPNDLLHWQTVVAVGHLPDMLAEAARHGGRQVSRRNHSPRLGVLIRDPDGHAVLLQEP